MGSNDLNHYSPELLSKEFEDLIEYIQERHRFNKILISLVLQKMGGYQFNRKAREFNQLLKNLCLNKRASYVSHNNIKTDHLFRADKVHLSDRRTAVFVNNLKKQLRGNVSNERKYTRNGMNNFGSNKKFKNLLQRLIEMIEC